MRVVVFAAPCQIILILLGVAGLLRDRHVALRLGVSDLDVIGQQELGEQPGREDLLRVFLVENADRRALRNHLRICRIILRDRQNCRLEIDELVGRDVRKRSI